MSTVRVAAMAFAFALVPFLGACAAKVPEHVLRMADGTSDYRLEPYFVGTEESSDLTHLTGAALVLWNKKLEVTPDLLAVVPSRANGGISRDFRRITLHLLPNLRWSDGAPLTAADVVFTAHEMTDGGGIDQDDAWQQVQWIRAVDPQTVVFETRFADADYVKRYLFGGMRYVLPEHLLRGISLDKAAAFNHMPVGAGPFRYAKVDFSSEIVLERNPYFHGPPSKLARIVVKILPDGNTELVQMRSGELDLIINLPYQDQLAARDVSNARILKDEPTYELYSVMLNFTSPITADPVVRRALRYATDRKAIASLLQPGRAPVFEETLIPQDPMHADLPDVPYDPARARQLLDSAGWHVGADGFRSKDGKALDLDFIIPANNPLAASSALIVQQDWEKVGARVNVRSELLSIMYAENGRLRQGKFDAVLSNGMPPASFIDYIFSCADVAPHGFNMSRFCDPRLERLFVALDKTDDPKQRKALYDDVQHLIEDAAIMINLVQLPGMNIVGRRVHGLYDSPWNRRDAFKDLDAS